MRRALAIDESSYGPHHPDVATDLNNLDELISSHQPGWMMLRPLIRRALAIDEKSYGTHHPRWPTDLNNSGLLAPINQTGMARPSRCCAGALDIHENSFGPYHPKVAKQPSTILAECVQDTSFRPRPNSMLWRPWLLMKKAWGLNIQNRHPAQQPGAVASKPEPAC